MLHNGAPSGANDLIRLACLAAVAVLPTSVIRRAGAAANERQILQGRQGTRELPASAHREPLQTEGGNAAVRAEWARRPSRAQPYEITENGRGQQEPESRPARPSHRTLTIPGTGSCARSLRAGGIKGESIKGRDFRRISTKGRLEVEQGRVSSDISVQNAPGQETARRLGAGRPTRCRNRRFRGFKKENDLRERCGSENPAPRTDDPFHRHTRQAKQRSGLPLPPHQDARKVLHPQIRKLLLSLVSSHPLTNTMSTTIDSLEQSLKFADRNAAAAALGAVRVDGFGRF
ncbi:hypothetical protein B0H17DRAFT_1231995 [Mycena rosella]|uniref:Uncharacterized protein n=1 Tax=Mycena rosella TaxID=1033263 RepID=A0AAD7F8M3_MYCRO|nr:hypothetical protein B0H17DRAFT_1231995 [Mycena rosella]